MKIHGDDGWESFPSYLDVLAPRALDVLARHQLRITFFVVGQDAALAGEPRRARLARRRRSRDRQPLVPPRALAPPVLGAGARRGARAGRGRDRVGDRSADRRVPRPGLQPLRDDAARPAPARVRVRRVDAADVHRTARARVLLPDREAHRASSATERELLYGTWSDGRARGAPLPLGGRRPHVARAPGHDAARGQGADPRELPADAERVLAGRGPRVLRHRVAGLSCCGRRAVDPAAPAGPHLGRRRQGARVLPRHADLRSRRSWRASIRTSSCCQRHFDVVPVGEHARALAATATSRSAARTSRRRRDRTEPWSASNATGGRRGSDPHRPTPGPAVGVGDRAGVQRSRGRRGHADPAVGAPRVDGGPVPVGDRRRERRQHRRDRRAGRGVRAVEPERADPAPPGELPARSGAAVRVQLDAGRLRRGDGLRPQLRARAPRADALRDPGLAGPHRHRVAVREGRQDDEHPVRPGG